MQVIATDLDRTLLPNGKQKPDSSMPIFHKIVKDNKLIFVTGRNLRQVKNAITKYKTPTPDFIIGEVGTKIYSCKGKVCAEDLGWLKLIGSMTKNWNLPVFKEQLSLIKSLRIQEKDRQNEFKLSYYVDDIKKSHLIIREVTKLIQSICKDATIIYSEDETRELGLLDILPQKATKLAALEYLRKNIGIAKRDVIYCGDSGNDILPLTYGYKSILVRNAIPSVKSTVKQLCIEKGFIHKLYIANGHKKLNGYYFSGIIEGLIKFNLVPAEYAE
ncbi:MAG: HAD-IIB family hydrolase [bacterium]|nr:HAD-IIB family hydrolase [bacterium]